MSANTSLGRLPPKLGSSTGFLPVLCSMLASVKRTQALSGSSRVACITSGSLASMPSKPCAARCCSTMSRSRLTSVPTTKRMCMKACAAGGMALTGKSGLPVL
ncbi:hypothetical protein D9M69_726590 [compost metagenome]